MTLTLSVLRSEVPGALPGEFVVDQRSATIGRAAGCDWVLPDPTRHVSSRHFEIRSDGREFVLTDVSTNGTCLTETGQRLAGPHRITDGDSFTVGPYTIVARLGAAASPPPWQGWDGPPTGANSGWDAPPSSPATAGWDAPPASGGWDTAPPARAGGGWQPQLGPSLARAEPHRAAAGWGPAGDAAAVPSSGWAPAPAQAPSPGPSTWDAAMPASDPASGWSSAAPDRPPPPSPNDLWGQIADGNVVDWARGGFGQPVETPRDPLGLGPAASSQAPAPPPAPTTPPSQGGDRALLAALGVDAARLGDPREVGARTGGLFRKLVAGLVVMLEARARAKAQLGAEATAFSPDGHNPLKFARTPDEAIALLVGSAQPGFMSPDRAVEDAFQDLQQHQVATLKAMQGALRATLERFSPTAIRARATSNGVLERIVPAARDAALWQAYEREFGGVALGSDEAFLDMFAKEFRDAYNAQSRSGRP